jgi:hydroxyacylglutathione hydrolase
MSVIQIGGRGWDCNQFLLKDSKSNAYDLVDAGHGQDFNHVLSNVAAVIDPHRVRTIAITHEHLDHVNGLPRWQELGASIVASPACAEKLRIGHDPTSAKHGLNIPTLNVDVQVTEGDTIRLGDQDHSCLLSPGHSPGSVCYWDEGTGTLFSGDVLFAQGGIGRFDFDDGNLNAHLESILRLGKLPVRALHCGHGPSVEGDDAGRSVHDSVNHVQSCVADAKTTPDWTNV